MKIEVWMEAWIYIKWRGEEFFKLTGKFPELKQEKVKPAPFYSVFGYMNRVYYDWAYGHIVYDELQPFGGGNTKLLNYDKYGRM